MSAAPPLPGKVRGLAAVSFGNDLASEMVYPLLPALVTGPLGGGAALLGALDSAADLTAALLRLGSGRLADRPGWRAPLILVGYLIAVMVRPVIGLAGAAWQVVVLRVTDRVGKGLRSPARDALLASVTPVEIRGRAFGFHRAADHAGAVTGAVAAGVLLSTGTSVQGVILWSVVPGVVVIAVLLQVLRGATAAKAHPATREPDGSGERIAPSNEGDAAGATFWVPASMLAALVVVRLPEALLLLRLQETGLRLAWVPLAWGGLHVVRSAVSYPGGALVDRIGAGWALALGGIAHAVVVGVMASTGSPTAQVGLFLTLGLVTGVAEPAERVLTARLAPIRPGRGFGTVQGITGLAALPMAVGFGVVYQQLGGAAALLASAGLSILVAAWWLRPAVQLAPPRFGP